MSDASVPTNETYPRAILEAIGDVSRPVRALEPNEALDHIVGSSTRLDGILSFGRLLFGGVDWARSVVRSYPPIFRMRFGARPTVCVADPDDVLAIFRNEDGAYSCAVGWRGNFDRIDHGRTRLTGPLFTDFDAHREVRKLLVPAFSGTAVAHYIDVAYPLFARTVDAWIARREVDAKPEIRSMLAALSGRIFLGQERAEDHATLDRLMRHVWLAPLALAKNETFDPMWRTATRAYRELTRRLVALIEERRTAPTPDLLGRIASATEGIPNEVEDDVSRASVVFNVLLGAFDTTACGLASTTYLVAKHPEWQEKMRAEAFALGARPITLDETRALEVTDRVWKEAMRLFPITASVPRYTLREVVLQGQRIPAGTLVSPMTNTLLYDERFWTDPDRFDPDRFSPERAEDKKHRAAYLPFGSGAHACIGMQLATAEVKAFFHALLTRARIRLATDYVGKHRYAPMGVVSGKVRVVVEPL